MDSDEIRKICRKRVRVWIDHLVGSHATPVMLLGIGHDHNSGGLVLCLPDAEEFGVDQVKRLLVGALLMVDRGQPERSDVDRVPKSTIWTPGSGEPP